MDICKDGFGLEKGGGVISLSEREEEEEEGTVVELGN